MRLAVLIILLAIPALAQDAGTVQTKIQAVCPVAEVSVGKNGELSFKPAPDATPDQIAAAKAILASWSPADDQKAAALEKRLALQARVLALERELSEAPDDKASIQPMIDAAHDQLAALRAAK